MLRRSAALDTIPLPALVRSAERICRERVTRKLERGADPHPCPACGWVQADMVRELRRRFAGRLRTAGAYLAVACAFLVVLFLALGAWFHFHLIDFDLDWFGVAAASAAGCALGGLMILARRALGSLRYRAGAHYTRATIAGTPTLLRPQ